MKLPNSISPAFIEWLDRGGHKIELKKNAMIVKKQFSDGVKRSVIPFERHEIKEFYELDEYLSKRYELFLTQWFKYGKGFIEELQKAMYSKYCKAVHLNNLAKVA
ncbi:hypothetical protein [Acinetobacter sp. CFCC 11171]|uniref:hypothetical protein n=1 Tax=Acinetobacter sp. CFCC 11171 TaxID=1775558 RepID=UPI000DD0C344|nr:hypothetical protein [Acinetobacter sp. CFCC 11171]